MKTYTEKELREKVIDFIRKEWPQMFHSNTVKMLTDFALSLQPLPDRYEEKSCDTCIKNGMPQYNLVNACMTCMELSNWQPKPKLTQNPEDNG